MCGMTCCRCRFVQALVQQREKFCSSQQARVDEFMQFVKQQRLKRKQVSMQACMHVLQRLIIYVSWQPSCISHGCWFRLQLHSAVQRGTIYQVSAEIACLLRASGLKLVSTNELDCRGLPVQPSSHKEIPQLLRMLGKSGVGPPYLLGAKLVQAETINLKHGLDDRRWSVYSVLT